MHTISLTSAVFININIMLGAGLFINTTELAHRAGSLGWLAYAVVGLLMLPLILSIAHLVRMHPSGGFYTFGAQELHPFAGFLSTWAYSTGKLASAAIITYSAVILLQHIIPALTVVHPIAFSIGILLFFGFLNTYNVTTGSKIQRFFLGTKLIPLLAVLIAGMCYFSGANLGTVHMLWDGIPSSIPLVLYAFLGFEAACSLSSKIENPEKNAPRAIVISFFSLTVIYCLYQFFVYTMFGNTIQTITNFSAFFGALAPLIAPSWSHVVASLLYGSVAASALGGAYGILYSNMWNMHALATHNYLPRSSMFKALNKQQIPVACVVLEVAICVAYLVSSWGTQLPLQQIASLGCSIAYTISVLALIAAKYKRNASVNWFMPLGGLATCLVLVALCIAFLLRGGSPTLLMFVSLLAAGIGMFFATYTKPSAV